MLVRLRFAPFAALPLMALPTGCGPCDPVPWLSAKECPGSTVSDSTTSNSSTSLSTGPTATETATTDSTTPAGSESESGTGIDTDSGSSSTAPGGCGNGELDPGEDCDDGNKTPGDGCEPDCTETLPLCGDGKRDPEEECDDGNEIDSDACVGCKTAACGDGHVQFGVENCDDGANNDMYGFCAKDCQGPGARCGDGVKNGPEDCDDNNQIDDDDCSDECVAPRLVFVTSLGFTGNLGGLSGADKKCSDEAINVGISQEGDPWHAWLSDGRTSAAQRLDATFTGYYRRTDGKVVAHGWADLIDGNLSEPIDVRANGMKVLGNFTVWTNTLPDASSGGSHCKGWTSAAFEDLGLRGAVGAIDATWTDKEPQACSGTFRLYCFQD